MKLNKQTFLCYLLLVSLFAVGKANAEQNDIPSYADSVKKFMSDSAKSGKKSGFSESEYQLMQQAAKRLAERMPSPGLRIGEHAPDFELPNAHGKMVRLTRLLKQGPVVLVFYRGAWCPFCNLQLHALMKSYPSIQKFGASVIAITPQKPDKSLEQVKKSGFPFEILSDLNSQTMQTYKLYYEVEPELVTLYKRHGLDLVEFNGKNRNVLPVPATYILDSNGIIRAGEADTDYKNRMEPGRILQALAEISSQPAPRTP